MFQVDTYIDDDFECYKREHGDFLHADDTYAFFVDVCYATKLLSVVIPTNEEFWLGITYKMKFMITKTVYGTVIVSEDYSTTDQLAYRA